MLYLPITRAWLLSRTARAVYWVAAVLVLTLVAAVIGISLALAFSEAPSLGEFPFAMSLVKAILFPGILGSAVLTIGMWYFWFNFDTSSWMSRALWAILLYLLAPVGPVLYFFFVYLRNPEVTRLSKKAVVVLA